MTQSENSHEELESFAAKFGGTVLIGYLCSLLLFGKFVHHKTLSRGAVFGLLLLPPALLSGLLGLIVFAVMESVDAEMAFKFSRGLAFLKTNLINFVFAALTLGLLCGRSSSKHATVRGVIASLFHEGMPMMIYSQILIWGQTACCLFVCCLSTFFGHSGAIPPMFTAMVTLGLEVGADFPSVVSSHKSLWSASVVEESESLGLICACSLGIAVMSLRYYLVHNSVVANWVSQMAPEANSWLREALIGEQVRRTVVSSNLNFSSAAGPMFSSEGFERRRVGPSNHKSHSSVPSSPVSFPGFGNTDSSTTSTTCQPVDTVEDTAESENAAESETSRLLDAPLTSAAAPSAGNDANDNNAKNIVKYEYASLGTHLSTISLSVFVSFLLCFIARIIEIRMNIENTHMFSGIRLFKLSMFSAMVIMHITVKHQHKIRFHREWFMRLCGLMLDLLIIAALSAGNPKPKSLEHTEQYAFVLLLVGVCVMWNLFCFFFLAHWLFPNFWFERGLVLMSDSLGHSFTGLLFARALDPGMVTPVPAAYAYKLILFFIPTTGGKNTIMVKMLDSFGPFVALLVCLCVLSTWWLIFQTSFKSRFVPHSNRQPGHAKGHVCDNVNMLEMSLMKDQPNSGDQYDSKDAVSQLIQGSMDTISDAGGRFFNSDAPCSSPGKYCAPDVDQEESVGVHQRRITPTTSSESLPAVSVNDEPSKSLTVNTTLSPSSAAPVNLKDDSSILSAQHINDIASWLPISQQCSSWELTYSLQRDGASLDTMLMLCGASSQVPTNSYFADDSRKERATAFKPANVNRNCHILVIQDSWGYIFGGYIGSPLFQKTAYYGNGESFVFSLVPSPRAYKWTGRNDFYLLSTGQMFAMGGGGGGYAFQVDNEFDTGVSNRSDTFDNNILASNEFFKCHNVELWTLSGISSSV